MCKCPTAKPSTDRYSSTMDEYEPIARRLRRRTRAPVASPPETRPAKRTRRGKGSGSDSGASKRGAASADPPTSKNNAPPPRKKRHGRAHTSDYAQTPSITSALPPEIVQTCLTYVSSNKDRFSLQTTCRSFRLASSAPTMLRALDVIGTGKGTLIHAFDSPGVARDKLLPYPRRGIRAQSTSSG